MTTSQFTIVDSSTEKLISLEVTYKELGVDKPLRNKFEYKKTKVNQDSMMNFIINWCYDNGINVTTDEFRAALKQLKSELFKLWN